MKGQEDIRVRGHKGERVGGHRGGRVQGPVCPHALHALEPRGATFTT